MDSLILTAGQRRRLERQLKTTPDARLYRRTLAVLEVDRSKPIAEVAQALGVTPRSVYYWIATYAQDHDPTALRDDDRSGRPSLWTPEAKDLLGELLRQSPQDLGYAAVEWTVPLLQEHLRQGLGLRFSDDTIRRELQRRRYVWKRSRYVLDPDPELEKKTTASPPYPAFAAPDRSAG
jgi:transposase